MPKIEKKLNKRLIWLVIWSAAIGWLASTKKWQEITDKTKEKVKEGTSNFIDFIKSWIVWLKESLSKKDKNQKSDSEKLKDS